MNSPRRYGGVSPRQRRLLRSARARGRTAAVVVGGGQNEDGGAATAGVMNGGQSSSSATASPPPQSNVDTSPLKSSLSPIKRRESPNNNSTASSSQNDNYNRNRKGPQHSEFPPAKQTNGRGGGEATGGSGGSGASTAVLTEATSTTASLETGMGRLRFDHDDRPANDTSGGEGSANAVAVERRPASAAATAAKGTTVGDRIRALNQKSGIGGEDARWAKQPSNGHSRVRQPSGRPVGECAQEETRGPTKGPLHERQDMMRRKDVIAPYVTTDGARRSPAKPRERRRPPPARHPSDELDVGPGESSADRRSSSGQRGKLRLSPTKQASSSAAQPQRCPSDEIGTAADEPRYYRVTFRGVASLLSEDELFDEGGRGKLAAHQPTSEEEELEGTHGGTHYVGHGEIVGTHSPEITVPLRCRSNEGGGSGERSNATAFVRAIRVDSILTGGYANDRVSLDGTDGDDGPNRPTNESDDSTGHYGYLILSDHDLNRNRQSIAEPLSNSASASLQRAVERGPFLYRVAASSPLPVLSGPSPDAAPLGLGLLPGSAHEVSLRVAMPLHSANGDGGEADNGADDGADLVDDADAGEVRYLKLAARRGWVADRRVADVDRRLRAAHLMRDVTRGEREGVPGSVGGGDGRSGDDGGGIEASLSLSFEDNSSLHSSAMNSTAMNSTADGSFYSSVVASSVATPKAVRSRRTRNKRRPPRQAPLSAFPTAAVGESFEEAGSSITGIGDGSTSLPDDGLANEEPSQQNAKTYYLMRVTAPAGLKILDAPHFQVSNLIHHGPTAPPSRHRDAPGTSPFVRTSPSASPTSGGGRKRPPSGGARCLARGRIFEAAGRMEATDDGSLYTNGRGLIQLADGSGWAIVPHDAELAEGRACEEIGSAIVPAGGAEAAATPRHPNARERSPDAGIVWLRIVAPPLGVKVLLPPPEPQPGPAATNTPRRDDSPQTAPRKPPAPPSTAASDSVEAASVISSSFFDSVWNRVAVTPTKERDRRQGQASPPQRTPQKQQGPQPQQQTIPIIPCGTVVPVERWDSSDEVGSKSFVRLLNGQGWIPRRLGDTTYARAVDAPDVRDGSFWFRVKSVDGLDVRHGPSGQAPIIKSNRNDAAFRFECGEFLRASEVVTIRERSDSAVPVTECFAKLYRRRDRQHLGVDNATGPSTVRGRYASLKAFATPGEWVQIRAKDGRSLLEECPSAPSIERHRDGWRYAALRCSSVGLCVRRGPAARAAATGEFIREGEGFLVSERVTATDSGTWLRLMDGRGWVQRAGIDGEAVVVPSGGEVERQRSQRVVRQILTKGSRRPAPQH
ncbi:hypothetical protein ACHAXT_011276 [Thalassiosira profunda]